MPTPTFDLLDLTAQVRAIGRAAIFYASGAFPGSGSDLNMTHLGDTEGEVSLEPNASYSELKLPELTGDIPHEKYISGVAPVIKMPLYAADAALRAITSPTGSASGGYERRRSVTEYTLALIPEDVFIVSDAQQQLAYTTAGGWTVNAVSATAAQLALLDLAFWAWRGHFDVVLPMYKHEDGGKVVQEVSFFCMHNAAMPDGHHVYTIGQPNDASIEISSS